MCGIAGYLGCTVADSDRLNAAMRVAIRYRGLDGEGEWRSPGEVQLFHSRLSILDLEGGAQPMIDGSGRYVIVFNGEIYNYLELKQAYSKAGAQFRTNSDTEVILEGYKLKGAAVCRELNGMFAFAIWDKVERRLFLARDRLGKKPLYWTHIGGAFFFGSSLDAFHGIPGWTAQLSLLNLDAYAAIGNFLPGETAFRLGYALPPASHAIVDYAGDRRPRIETYWRLDFSRKFSGTLDEAIDEFEDLITDATAIRLRADVPVALTFSGGVDSGIIAAVTKVRLGQSLSCWTIDYHTDDDQSQETLIARAVAEHLGLEWHHRNFDYHRDLLPALRDALRMVDQPCRHIALSYSRRLYAAIRPAAKVVLSGNGADELFLGYAGNENLAAQDGQRHEAPWRTFLRRALPKRLGQRFARTKELADYQAAYVRANLGKYRDEDDPEAKVQAIRQGIVESNVASHADLYTYMALSHYTSDANFRIPDIAGLAEQVEVRSPFLDYRLVEFAARLPTPFKIGSHDRPDNNKLLLKHYYRRYVPEEVAWAAKKGMGENLRYDRTLATDPALVALYERLLGSIAAAGLPEGAYRKGWQEFLRDKREGVRYPPSAGVMSTGLMLGLWLERSHA
jgi:asparagine synthase (glutamine-hydrolysing)